MLLLVLLWLLTAVGLAVSTRVCCQSSRAVVALSQAIEAWVVRVGITNNSSGASSTVLESRRRHTVCLLTGASQASCHGCAARDIETTWGCKLVTTYGGGVGRVSALCC
jgi:hypothetical protein